MSVARIFLGIAAALALLTAAGCQSSGSGGSRSEDPPERLIMLNGREGTFFVHVPVADKSHADVPASSPDGR